MSRPRQATLTPERLTELKSGDSPKDGELLELLELSVWALAQREKNRLRVAAVRKGKDSGGAPKTAGKAVSVQKKAHREKTPKTVAGLLETGKVSRGMPESRRKRPSVLDTPPIPAAVQEVVRKMEQPEVRRPVLGSAFLSLKGPMQTDLTKPQLKTKGKEKK